jgi:hypothetical protein
MRKINLILIAILAIGLVFATSCKKRDQEEEPETTDTDYQTSLDFTKSAQAESSDFKVINDYGIKEPVDSRELTHCCGGPIESLYPSNAARIGEKRVAQFANGGSRAVTMCPICLGTLRKASAGKIEINDISTLLMKAYCERNMEGVL